MIASRQDNADAVRLLLALGMSPDIDENVSRSRALHTAAFRGATRAAKVLIDAGVPGQSTIFENALELIDGAQEWLLLTCQFFPNSVTAAMTARASNEISNPYSTSVWPSSSKYNLEIMIHPRSSM